MMRVTREQGGEGLVIRLEGDLSGEFVDLVRRECCVQRPPQRLRIDLGRLGRADEAGLKLLRELRGRGDVELLNCPPILHTLMNGMP